MTPKTYADVCRMECPDGCGSDGHKPVVTLNGTPHHILYESRTDGVSTRQWTAGYLPCTAPTPEALIERLLAEAVAMHEELARLKGERTPKLRFNLTAAPKKGEPGWLADEVL